MATEIFEPTAESGLPPRPSRRRVVLGVAALAVVAAALVPELLTNATPAAPPVAPPPTASAPPAPSAAPSPGATTESAFVAPPSTSPELTTPTPNVSADAAVEPQSAATPAAVPVPAPILRVPARDVVTDDEVRRLYDELSTAAYALAWDPDPARVPDVYDRSCPCYDEFLAYTERDAAEGLHEESTLPEVLEFRVRARSEDGNTIGVEVIERQDHPGRVLDAAGNVVETYPPRGPQRAYVTMIRGEDLWRVSQIYFPDGPQESAA